MTAILDYFYRLLPANPILLRVVESGGKRRRDLFIRCIYLGLLVGLVLFAILFSGNDTSSTDLSALAKTSSKIFQQMSYLQLGLVALLAPIFTAGAITQEKDSQTYDILLATPLTNGQIILGSLMSRLFFIVALLVSGIPIFSITQIFGGVAIRSIVLSFGIATATAFMTGALAMAIATFKVGTRRTIFSFYLFIVAYLGSMIVLDTFSQFHPIIGVDPRTGDAIAAKTSWFTGFNPFLALRTLFNDPRYVPPNFESLPEGLRRWPIGWLLSNPASFYVSFMFLMSFLLVMPSIVLLRRMAQATITEKPLHRLIMGGVAGVLVLIALLAGGSSGIYIAGVLAIVAFGFLLPWIRDPSWVPILNRAESTDAASATTAGSKPVGRRPRSRKPRTVWSNPIAWREAKTKASAARASLLRYGFIFAGLVGAVILVYRFSRVNVPQLAVSPNDFNPSLMQLTIGTETYRVPTFDSANPNDYPIQREVEDTSNPGQMKFESFALTDMKTQMEVIPNSLTFDRLALGRTARTITRLQLRPVSRMLEANDARKYLLGLTIIEFAVILLIVTNAAASTVTREKEDGTLDLLLSSPITSRYYIWGKLRGLVSFVLPLVAVPVASALIFVVYDLARLSSSAGDPDFKWIVFPEAVVLLPGMLIIVSAFAAILGMQMSLRCRTTVMAVMSSVGIVVGICAAMGWCGYGLLSNGSSNSGIAVGIGSFSPFTLMQMMINPYGSGKAFTPTMGDEDPVTSNRLIIVVCSLIAIAGYTAIVWSMYQSMVKNFDMTIRRQSR